MSQWEKAIGNYQLSNDLFLADLRQSLAFQIEHCEIYRYLCQRQDFSPNRDLLEPGDLHRIPYLTSNVFKESRGLFERLLTLHPDEITHWTTSSGTSGDRSWVGRTAAEMAAYRLAYRVGFREYAGREAFDETLLFFPDPSRAIGREGEFRRGTIAPFGIFIGYEAGDRTPSAKRHYLPRWDDDLGDFIVEGPTLFDLLRELDKGGKRVYLGGSPPILATVLHQGRKTGECFSFGPRCKVQFGSGGWEALQRDLGFEKEEVKSRMVHHLCEILGIEHPHAVDDSYGATETPAALMGHYSPSHGDFLFHPPPWLRVIVRDPQSLLPIQEGGRRGLLEIIMPYGTGSYAGVAILMDDVAEWIDQGICPQCGRSGGSIRVVERAWKGPGGGRGCGAVMGSENP